MSLVDSSTRSGFAHPHILTSSCAAAILSGMRCKWLRSHGVISSKPLHTLRKEFGSQIHARYGLLAASEALRHGGVSVTARHYIENKQRSVLGFGHLLKSESHKINAAWGI